MSDKELEVMFPGKEILVLDGKLKVLVSPLSLEDLPKVAESFSKLMKYADNKIGQAEIAAKGLVEVLQLVPFCINVSPSQIPATDVPDILEAVVELNFTEDTVGKWTSLIQKVIGAVESLKDEAIVSTLSKS